ncbi:MAG: His/Gly/Thr/Pro-type tRNA ligase C-terminal domain-containing protein, partial [Desulfatiglandales bacterium]
GIEVGHVFKLGTKYSRSMHAVFLDERGEEKLFFMGCYGIGIARTVAAAIEQNHDRDGIIFPISIAPFEVTLLPLQMHEKDVVETSERIYGGCLSHGLDILLDDRDVRPGVKFKDADLMGTPVRITVGERTLKQGLVELKVRSDKDSSLIPVAQAAEAARSKVKELYDQIK